jgi:ClpP class serine protease
MQQVGVTAKTLTRGKGKDSLNPLRPWTEEEDLEQQQLIDYFYTRFLDVLHHHRPHLTHEKLSDLGAKLVPAEQALSIGLIEEIAYDYQTALHLSEKIFFPKEENPHYHVVTAIGQTSLLEELRYSMKSLSPQQLIKGAIMEIQKEQASSSIPNAIG